MVQAPLHRDAWPGDLPGAAAASGSQAGNAAAANTDSLATIHEHTNDTQAIAALKAKQRTKARAPSFTSSPLTQRPLSPSAMSDSGSESSTSTARAIDIPRPSHRHHRGSPGSNNAYRPYSHTSRRSITALTFGEALASSSSEDEKEETLPQTTPNRSSPLSSSYRRSPESSLFNSRNRRLSGSPGQTMSVSPGVAGSPPAPQSLLSRSHRRRSSGNYGNTSLSTSVSSTPPASPSLFSSSFVGSYEASLLSGRMANRPSNSAALPFLASLGVLGLGKNTPRGLKCPDHVVLPFGAYFWDMDNAEKQGKGSPYVGTLDLEEHYMQQMEDSLSADSISPKFPGYRIPPKGQIQLVVKNANHTAVKLFLVPYDLTDMPPGSKTFIRQKSYDIVASSSAEASPSGSASPVARPKETLRYAVHLQFCAPPTKERERGRKKSSASRRGGAQASISASPRRAASHSHSPAAHSPKVPARPRSDTTTASHIYLHKSIRLVFSSRALDLSEKLKVALEDPLGVQTQSSSSPLPSGKLKAEDGREDEVPSAPASGRFSAYTGPGEAWEELKRRKHAIEKVREAPRDLHHPVRRSQIHSDPNAALWNGASPFPGSVGSSRSGMPLLNTPPLGAFSSSGSSRRMHIGRETYGSPSSFLDEHESATAEEGRTVLDEAADVPEPLVFQRSPVPSTVPLPALMESGLSISRPSSRSEMCKAPALTSTTLASVFSSDVAAAGQAERREGSASPERRSFGAVSANSCLR